MKTKLIFIQKIILSILVVGTATIFIHLCLDAKNRNNCIDKVNNCDNGVERYTYSSNYIGKCDCKITCK